MMLESPKKSLAQRHGLTWAALIVGLERRWVTQKDVAQAAVDWLERNPSADLRPALLLAVCEADDADAVRERLEEANRATGNETIQEAVNRWRWAFLSDLASERRMDDETKIQRLQEIYAEFGYPNDMATCGRYVESGRSGDAAQKCPLEAMRELIPQLEIQVFI